MLPSGLPNLLVNGTAGIAVGMATNMAPHNLGEVIAAARHLIANPEASLDELMRFVPGPDLPTGGKIVGLDGIREAYETGRGIFRTRATARIEKITPRRDGIVVTELPYGVGPEKVIARIKDLVQARKLAGISDLKDLTDRHRGLHLVIEIRGGFHPEAILDELYRLTPMEETFGINNVALVDGQPRVLGLRELLSIYVDHRIEVVRRRSEFRRRKRADRLHLVDGLLIALLNIDEVIQVIRASDDSAQAKERLMSVFDLSEIQAQYILDTPLRRLTRYDRLELERERETLQREIAELTAILESETRLRELVSSELGESRRAVRQPAAHRAAGRQRQGPHGGGAARGGRRPVPGAAVVRRAHRPDRHPARWRAGRGHAGRGRAGLAPGRAAAAAGPRAAHDVIIATAATTARGTTAVVTSQGRLIRIGVLEIPALPPSAHSPALAGGAPIAEFVVARGGRDRGGAGRAGRVAGRARARHRRAAWSSGSPPDYPANATEFEVISLKDGDRVVGAVQLSGEDTDLVFITSDAQLLRFRAAAVRPQGRAAGGMAGIRLSAGAAVVWFGAVPDRRPDRRRAGEPAGRHGRTRWW